MNEACGPNGQHCQLVWHLLDFRLYEKLQKLHMNKACGPNGQHCQLVWHLLYFRLCEKLQKLLLNKACGPNGQHCKLVWHLLFSDYVKNYRSFTWIKLMDQMDLPSMLWKNVLDLDILLSLLLTKSLQTCVVPQDWRDANITPLFKKGSRLSPNNYRPVSLTSQVVKILEKIVYDQLMEFIVDDIISFEQQGFQKKMLLCDAASLMPLWLDCSTRQKKPGVDVIYFDFRKAFDSAPQASTVQASSSWYKTPCFSLYWKFPEPP